MRFRAVLAALLVTLPVLPTQSAVTRAANAPAPVLDQMASHLIAHRALYTLTYNPQASQTAHSGADIVAAHGTMGYEVIDACDGWAVRQRLQMLVTNSDGQEIEMASDYATWEAKDGLKFRFHMKQTTDTAVTTQTDGDAFLRSVGGAGEAHYIHPHEATKTLPAGTFFPTAHTVAILAAARDGKKFLTLPLFDGTDEAGAEDSSIAIIDWKQPFQTKFPILTALPSAKVRLAFFDRTPGTTTPSYQVGLRYWENGVADDMQMDFGDFVMDAKMTDLSPQPRKC